MEEQRRKYEEALKKRGGVEAYVKAGQKKRPLDVAKRLAGEEGAVSDGCLAALRAASEVIGEKCGVQGEKTDIFEKKSPCWLVIGTIGAIIRFIVVEDVFRIYVKDTGHAVEEARQTNSELKCRGTFTMHIEPRGVGSFPQSYYDEAVLEKIVRDVKKKIEEDKEHLTELALKDVLLYGEGLKVMDFGIDDIKFEPDEGQGYSEADIILRLHAIVLKGKRTGLGKK